MSIIYTPTIVIDIVPKYACVLLNYKWCRILVLVLKIHWSYCHWRVLQISYRSFLDSLAMMEKCWKATGRSESVFFVSFVNTIIPMLEFMATFGRSHIEEYCRGKEEAKQASESKSSSGSSSYVGSTQEGSQSQPTINKVLSRKQLYP